MKENVIVEAIKNKVASEVKELVDLEIEKQVKKFEYELKDKKEEIIAKIMKGIRIYVDSETPSFPGATYRIIVEEYK